MNPFTKFLLKRSIKKKLKIENELQEYLNLKKLEHQHDIEINRIKKEIGTLLNNKKEYDLDKEVEQQKLLSSIFARCKKCELLYLKDQKHKCNL